jgi:hypothetical protein
MSNCAGPAALQLDGSRWPNEALGLSCAGATTHNSRFTIPTRPVMVLTDYSNYQHSEGYMRTLVVVFAWRFLGWQARMR